MMASMDPQAVAAMSQGAVSPEMARTAASMMKNLSPEAMEAMLKMGGGGGARGVGEGGMPQFTPEMQKEMQERMKDPQMMSMMTEMMKGMDPETLVRMSEQAGVKLTPEQAKRSQEAMASMTPAQMERVVRALPCLTVPYSKYGIEMIAAVACSRGWVHTTPNTPHLK